MSEAHGGPAAFVFRVDDSSQIGEARRAGEALAETVGLNANERGALAIVVTEAATNLARHARRGRILLSAVGESGSAGVQVVTVDEGPGIPHVARAMEDGYSSAGTSGHGLGAISRMAQTFDVYSRSSSPACGTLLTATVWSAAGAARETAATGATEASAVCVAYDGGRVCGDAWIVLEQKNRTVAVVVDGLGHGPEAAAAADEAVRMIRVVADEHPAAVIDAAHGALRSTRGAALAVAAIHPSEQRVHFAGIGNISVTLHAPDGTSRSLASLNGTVGHAMRTVQEFQYDWPAGGMLLMHSDGIHSRWRLDSYPGLTRHHPALVAGALYRDALRGRDDATVVALRERLS